MRVGRRGRAAVAPWNLAMDEGAPGSTEPLFDLMRRVARRDRAAFHSLYLRTAPQLFAIALRILRQKELAEDVLQECFVSVWERAPDYDQVRGSPMSWLTTIVRHRAIDHLRRIGARPEGAQAGEESLALLVAGEASGAERGAALADLSRCLGELDERARRAVVYAYAYGYTHEELAARLAAPLGTIKSWIRRSLERLKLCLDG